MPVPAPELAALVSTINQSIRAPEVRRLFVGIDFTKYRQLHGKSNDAPTTWFYAAKPLGFEVCCDGSDQIKLIFLYSALAKEGYASFAGALLPGLTLQTSPAEARETLGTPSKSGAGQLVPLKGKVGPWDRWDHPGYSLHIQYTASGRQVGVITLMAADMVP